MSNDRDESYVFVEGETSANLGTMQPKQGLATPFQAGQTEQQLQHHQDWHGQQGMDQPETQDQPEGKRPIEEWRERMNQQHQNGQQEQRTQGPEAIQDKRSKTAAPVSQYNAATKSHLGEEPGSADGMHTTGSANAVSSAVSPVLRLPAKGQSQCDAASTSQATHSSQMTSPVTPAAGIAPGCRKNESLSASGTSIQEHAEHIKSCSSGGAAGTRTAVCAAPEDKANAEPGSNRTRSYVGAVRQENGTSHQIDQQRRRDSTQMQGRTTHQGTDTMQMTSRSTVSKSEVWSCDTKGPLGLHCQQSAPSNPRPPQWRICRWLEHLGCKSSPDPSLQNTQMRRGASRPHTPSAPHPSTAPYNQQNNHTTTTKQQCLAASSRVGAEEVTKQGQVVENLKVQLQAVTQSLNTTAAEAVRLRSKLRDSQEELEHAKTQLVSQRASTRQQLDGKDTEIEVLQDRAYAANQRAEDMETQLLCCTTELSHLQAMLTAQEHQLHQQQGSSGDGANLQVEFRPSRSALTGPGMSAVSSLQQLLFTGSLDVGYGVPQIEAHLENLFQSLQSLACRPVWDVHRLMSRLSSDLSQHGLELLEPDSSLMRSVVCHTLLLELDARIFRSWHFWWAAYLLDSTLLHELLSMLKPAAGLPTPGGAQSAPVYLSACLIHVRDACRLALEQPSPNQNKAYRTVHQHLAKLLFKDLTEAGVFLPYEDAINALFQLVDLSLQLWMHMKAAHPLLTPTITPTGLPCPPGKATINRLVPGRATGSAEPRSAEDILMGDTFVLASLCPAASFMSTDSAAPLAAMESQDLLVPERVTAMKIITVGPRACRGNEESTLMMMD